MEYNLFTADSVTITLISDLERETTMGTSIRKIRWTLIATIVLMLFAKGAFGQSDRMHEQILLMQVLKSSGVSVKKTILTSSNQLDPDEPLLDPSLTKRKVERVFSIMLKAQQHPGSHDIIEYSGQKNLFPATTLQMKLVRQKSDQGKFSSLLLLKLTTDQNEQKRLKQYFDFITTRLAKLGLQANMKISIQGVLNKKLNHNEQYALLLSMFKKLDGHITEQLNEKKVISLTGMSRKLQGFVSSKSNKINLQISSRYNPKTEDTVITIGTPVITISY